jgi:hypothetical protein
MCSRTLFYTFINFLIWLYFSNKCSYEAELYAILMTLFIRYGMSLFRYYLTAGQTISSVYLYLVVLIYWLTHSSWEYKH